MTSLIIIDDDDDNAKCHQKSDDLLMMLWPLSLMMLPLDAILIGTMLKCQQFNISAHVVYII